MPAYRYLELIVYSVITLLPFMLVALYPVRDRLRFPSWAVILSLGLLCLINFARIILFALGWNSVIIALITLLIQIIFYCVIVRQHIGKSLFIALCITNLAMSLGMIAKCVEGALFPDFAMERGRWSYSVCFLVIESLTLFPVLLYLRKVYDTSIQEERTEGLWHIFWVVPATYYLIWYWHMFKYHTSPLEVLLSPVEAVFQLFVSAGSFFAYHSIISLVHAQAKNEKLQEKDYRNRLELAQYSALRDRVIETKKVRHDLRHHLRVISAYAQDGKVEELLHYVKQYDTRLETHSLALYCENYPVNALLQHFSARADRHGVSMQIIAALPEQLPISNETLAVLFGNLLENAAEATEKESVSAKIIVNCKLTGCSMYLRISNTCTSAPVVEEGGVFISTKEDNHSHGIGLQSVRDIVKRYDGIMEITHEEQLFSVFVMLPFPD